MDKAIKYMLRPVARHKEGCGIFVLGTTFPLGIFIFRS